MPERIRRSTRLVLALGGALVAIVAGASGIAQAQIGHELEHKLSEANSGAEAARAEEQALAGDIAAQSEAIDGLEGEIGFLAGDLAALDARLARSESRLSALEAELEQKTRELTRARQQLSVAQGRLSRRLVDLYTSDESDLVAVVFGAENLDDLLDRLETQSRILEYDAELVDQITELRERVTRERARTAALRITQAAETAKLARDTSAHRAAYSSLVARRDSLASLRSARQRSLAAVRVERSQWEAQADALEAESARLGSIVVSRSTASTSDQHYPTPTSAAPSSSGFVWPVSGTLVSPFGERWGRLHAGIDVAAPAGTPVVASAAGSVTYAGSMSGYGLIVVIQHAGDIATAYAHNSSISVSVGQPVGQGQAIAAVGCTGHCFGDHVHFEVRAGGGPVDPMGYL